jgi:shikimate kinase
MLDSDDKHRQRESAILRIVTQANPVVVATGTIFLRTEVDVMRKQVHGEPL